MIKKIKAKCISQAETSFEPLKFEATFRGFEERKYRGGELVQFKIRSDRPLSFDVDKVYSVEIKSAE